MNPLEQGLPSVIEAKSHEQDLSNNYSNRTCDFATGLLFQIL